MAKLRFIHHEPALIPLLGREMEPDEVVEVDDSVFAAYSWPETLWSVVTSPKSSKSAPVTEEA